MRIPATFVLFVPFCRRQTKKTGVVVRISSWLAQILSISYADPRGWRLRLKPSASISVHPRFTFSLRVLRASVVNPALAENRDFTSVHYLVETNMYCDNPSACEATFPPPAVPPP